MKAIKSVLIVCLIFAIILGSLILKTFRDAGEFKKINSYFKGQCMSVSGILSSEDITIDQRSGLAFISSDDRRPLFRGVKGRQGAIYAFDLKAEHPEPVDLTGGFNLEFHPHGIGLFVDKDGRTSLFVVNHRQTGHFVEVFDFKGGKLVHRESIGGALMHSPNDVIPVGPRSFYVTNDHGNASKLGRTLEEYMQLARSYVLYYNGNSFRKVAEGLAYANGINMSHNGETVYVAATVGRKIHVYDRDMDSGALELRQSIDLGTGLDNIEVDNQGRLWIGAHPRLLTFVKYSKDPRILSPSQVLKVRIEENGYYEVEQIYLGEGENLSGSSVAAVYNNRMLVGSVFDPRFLLCRLSEK